MTLNQSNQLQTLIPLTIVILERIKLNEDTLYYLLNIQHNVTTKNPQILLRVFDIYFVLFFLFVTLILQSVS